MSMSAEAKLAAYKEAAARADDTIAAMRQTIEVQRECMQVTTSALVDAKVERDVLRRRVMELETELAPYRREFGGTTA